MDNPLWNRLARRERERERWLWRVSGLVLAASVLVAVSIDWKSLWSTTKCPLLTVQIFPEDLVP